MILDRVIFDLVKVAPLAALATAGVIGKNGIKTQYAKYFAVPEVIATQSEVNDLAKMVYIDILSDTPVSDVDFSAYCRKNLLLKVGQARDTSVDRWGNPYVLVYLRGKFMVRSAGVDGAPDTEDDIVSGYNL